MRKYEYRVVRVADNSDGRSDCERQIQELGAAGFRIVGCQEGRIMLSRPIAGPVLTRTGMRQAVGKALPKLQVKGFATVRHP